MSERQYSNDCLYADFYYSLTELLTGYYLNQMREALDEQDPEPREVEA